MEAILPNPRVRRRRPTVELVRAVRDGRRVGEALGVLSAGDAEGEPEHDALAQQLARFLVRRCDERHQGWQVLRQVVLDAGGEVPWERCSRQAVGPTKDRVLRDCATPGRTPLVRVQHAAAQERARRIAALLDPEPVLRRLKLEPPAPVDAERWERALVAAVAARSREQAVRALATGLGC